MAGRPYVLREANFKQVANAAYQVAVLPWGATEAHNYHLPYGTDSIQCDYLAEESARIAWEAGARVLVLPTVPFGVQTGQLDIPLCLNLNPSTQAAVLRDLAMTLDRNGVAKLVIFNGHGGNEFRQIIRELQPQVKVFLCTMNWYTVLNAAEYFLEPGDHAGELETSVMQAVAPELVLPLSEAGDGAEKRPTIAAFREGWAWAPRPWSKVSADTGIGNPEAATAAKGAQFAAAVTRRVAGFLTELAATHPEQLYPA